MKISKILIVFGAVLLIGGAALAQGSLPDIYASHIDEGDGTFSEIGAISLASNSSSLLFEADDYAFEDVVVGPGCGIDVACSTFVYAFDPAAGLIIRFDPAWVGGGPLGIEDVEIVYQAGVPGGSGNILNPQSGWFTNRGDLIFTTRLDKGAWICEGIGFEAPAAAGTFEDPLCQIGPETVDNLSTLVDFDFSGAGITQAADGDALAIDTNAQGRIQRFEFDGPAGQFPNQPPEPLPSDDGLVLLSNPLGIARLSTGDIFVTADGSVLRFRPYRETPDSPKVWLQACDFVLQDDCGEEIPYFLEAAADDTVYVGTASDCGGSVWAVTVDDGDGYYCDRRKVFPVDSSYDWEPFTIEGLGVAPSATFTPPWADDGDFTFNFNDHVYELGVPDTCEPEIQAIETPAQCFEDIIANNVDFDGDGFPDPGGFNAEPVFYLGEKAFGITYDLSEGQGSQGCQPDEGEFIRHAVSAYTELLTNPRLIRCDIDGDVCDAVPGGGDAIGDVCTVVDLTSFFPFDGNLPNDGRIAGKSSTFSQYFLVDAGPGGYDPANPVDPADFCGFWLPFWNIENPDQSCLPTFFAGFPIKIRFRIATEDGHCWWGPWETDKEVLLSVARVRDADGNPVFEPMDLECLNADCSDQAIFNQPRWRWKPYNLRFSTCGWADGVYQASVVALDGSITPQVDHFRIVNW